MNGKIRSRTATTLFLITSLLTTLILLLSTTHSSTANAENSLKVIAPKALKIESDSAIELWHDYGSFALYRTSEETLERLPVEIQTQVMVLEQSDHLFVGEKGINTQNLNQQQNEVNASIQGESLYLVQFVGPIKEEWLAAVESTGADLVQYIANFGYMVWADAGSRQQLDIMAERGSFIQATLPYLSSFKLGPTLEVDQDTQTGGAELVAVTVQLYRHYHIQDSKAALDSMLVETLSPWEYVLGFQNIRGVVHKRDIAAIAELPDAIWIGEDFARELNDEVQGQIMANNLTANKKKPVGPGYLSWLVGLGLSTNPANYPILDITDDGIGNGVAADAGGDVTLRQQGKAAKPSRLAYIANCTSAPTGGGPDGHGHLNVSIAGGYDDRSGAPFRDEKGYQRGLGINPYGRFAGTRVFDEEFNTDGCGGTDSSLIRETYNRGARMISNSWGCRSCAGVYDAASQAYDAGVRDADPGASGNQEVTILFSSGNYGPEYDTIGTPGNGKNVITVGASENVRPTWTDGCGIPPSGADSVPDIADFSSRGPAPGGRTKPDVVAPGTHVQGTASTDPEYNGFGVCDKYHPTNQALFAASSGTSHSVPAVAGLATLAYGFLEQNYEQTAPSPALIKAFIVANTMYLNGYGSGGDLPSQDQGFGLPDMNAAFTNTPRVIVDQPEGKLFDQSGETWSLTVSAADRSKPVRIVMAFTDQPGAIGREPQVNDLNLKIEADGATYWGNQMKRQWSEPNGTPDAVNTVEAVFLPSLDDSSIKIDVIAFNIAGDGVPGVGDGTDQDFTLVCSNCVEQEDFSLMAQPQENSICLPGSADFTLKLESILGYSQPVTLSTAGLPAAVNSQFSKNPVVPTATSRLTLTAMATAAPGAYAVKIMGDSSDLSHITTVDLDLYSARPEAPHLLTPSNGTSDLPLEVPLTWTAVPQAASYEVQVALDPGFEMIVDEKTELSDTTYTTDELQTGQIYYWRVRAVNGCAPGKYREPSTFSTELVPGSCPIGVTPETIYFNDFESSIAGWSHNGLEDTWQLSQERAHSATTSFYAVDLGQISDQRLISPEIALPENKGTLTLQFWNYQSLESNELDDSVCFDGAVLEVSKDNGQSWQQVGGPPQDDSVLITDPYHGIISSEHDSPIAGKPAWCGDPQDWLNSVVDIDELAGQTVRFRFRLASDISIGSDLGHEGWYIDDFLVQACAVEFTNSYMPAVFDLAN